MLQPKPSCRSQSRHAAVKAGMLRPIRYCCSQSRHAAPDPSSHADRSAILINLANAANACNIGIQPGHKINRAGGHIIVKYKHIKTIELIGLKTVVSL
jgi:hypothetical protein